MVKELRATDRMGAIKELVDRLHVAGCVTDSLEFLQSVVDREDLESTVLGPGVAFPHTRSRSVSQMGLAVGQSTAGVTFRSDVRPEPVHTVCLLAVPAAGEGPYLALLGRLARSFQDHGFHSRLTACVSQNEMSQLIAQSLASPVPGPAEPDGHSK